MRIIGRAILAVAAAGLVLLTAPAGAEGAGSTTYQGSVPLRSSTPGAQYTLDRIQVSSTRVTLRLQLRNPGIQAATVTCPAKGAASRSEQVQPARGKPLLSIGSYCADHPGKRTQIQAGKTLTVTGQFSGGAWVKQPFALTWYGQTSGPIALVKGRITAVDAPPGSQLAPQGVVAKVREALGGGRWLWVLAGIGGFVVLGMWLRLLIRGGRILASAGAAGVAWYAGIHDWGLLLAIATGAAVIMYCIAAVFDWDGPSWGGRSGARGGGAGAGPAYDGGAGSSGGSGGWGGSDPGRGDRPEPAGVGSSGWGSTDGPKSREPDRSWYGDGPQQGTAAPADERGSLWGDGPQQGTSRPADEPGSIWGNGPG